MRLSLGLMLAPPGVHQFSDAQLDVVSELLRDQGAGIGARGSVETERPLEVVGH